MIDISKETVVSLSQAAKELPRRRNGKQTHSATLHRWATVGLGKIRLEVIKIGNTRCTSRQALQRFFTKLTEADGLADPRPEQTVDEQAERQLDALGVR